jgi:hypothetical protein
VTSVSATELDRAIISAWCTKRENKLYTPQQLKKKTSHDIAYLIILLLFVAGIFIFAMNFVNTHLPLP